MDHKQPQQMIIRVNKQDHRKITSCVQINDDNEEEKQKGIKRKRRRISFCSKLLLFIAFICITLFCFYRNNFQPYFKSDFFMFKTIEESNTSDENVDPCLSYQSRSSCIQSSSNIGECELFYNGIRCKIYSCKLAPKWSKCVKSQNYTYFALSPVRKYELNCPNTRYISINQNRTTISQFHSIVPKGIKENIRSFRLINPAIISLYDEDNNKIKDSYQIFSRLTNYIGCLGQGGGPCLKGTTNFSSIILRSEINIESNKNIKDNNNNNNNNNDRLEIVLKDSRLIEFPENFGSEIRDEGLEWWCKPSLHVYQSFFITGFEDPRVIRLSNGDVYLFFNSRENAWKSAMFVVKVVDEDQPQVESIHKLTINGKEMLNKEKNWSPFVFEDRIYIEYSIIPHIILTVDVNTGVCEVVSVTLTLPPTKINDNSFEISTENSLRGGPPSIYLKDLDLFLGLAHIKQKIASQFENGGIVYFSIFYLFEAQFPFSIQSFSNPFIFSSSHIEDFVGDWMIQFPSGLDESDGNIIVAYGEQDCDSVLAKISSECVLNLASQNSNPKNNLFFEILSNRTTTTYPYEPTIEIDGFEWKTWQERGWHEVSVEFCKQVCLRDESCTGFVYSVGNEYPCSYRDEVAEDLFCGSSEVFDQGIIKTQIFIKTISPLSRSMCNN